jgi:hypothetical protein
MACSGVKYITLNKKHISLNKKHITLNKKLITLNKKAFNTDNQMFKYLHHENSETKLQELDSLLQNSVDTSTVVRYVNL